MSCLQLDDNQATVGRERRIVYELGDDNASEARGTTTGERLVTSNGDRVPPSMPNSSPAYKRPPLANVFATVNVPKSGSEQIEPLSKPSRGSSPQPSLRDEETSNSGGVGSGGSGGCRCRCSSSAPLLKLSARRSRFPYRFKHHTVNLIAGGGDNRLISTDVLMGDLNDSSRRLAVTSELWICSCSHSHQL